MAGSVADPPPSARNTVWVGIVTIAVSLSVTCTVSLPLAGDTVTFAPPASTIPIVKLGYETVVASTSRSSTAETPMFAIAPSLDPGPNTPGTVEKSPLPGMLTDTGTANCAGPTVPLVNSVRKAVTLEEAPLR